MAEKLEGRVMVLENDMTAIRKYMERGVELRVENTQILTEIKTVCTNSQKYQERCDNERMELAEKVTVLETWRSNQAAAVTMRSSLVAGTFGLLTLALGFLGLKYGK